MELTEEKLDSILLNYVPKRYLTQKEACQYAGVSAKTLNKWLLLGLKTVIVEDGALKKYDTKDIDEFLEARKV